MNHNTLVESSFSATCNSPIENIPKVDVPTKVRRPDRLSAMASLRRHWPEYLMEVGEVGFYLCVACLVATLLQHPASIVRQLVSNGVARRALMGLAMGATAIAIVMSPWGKRSGGHFNPAVTFAFYRPAKAGFVRHGLLCRRAVHRRNRWSRCGQIHSAGSTWQSCCPLCRHRPWHIRDYGRLRG